MRFFSVLRMGEAYAKFALLILIAVFILFCLAYFVIYKKCMRGTRTLKVKQVLTWGLLLGYLIIVLCATMLDRPGITMRQVNLRLFDSYVQAWQLMDNSDWRNLILNILMFVPFGFLLPLTVRKCRAFWKTALCGLIFSALIEVLQFLTGRGISEADDLLNNTVGAVIGYGFAYLVLRFLHRKEGKKLWMFTAQIPLLAVILVFAGIYGIYEHQEYGNLALAKQKNLTVTSEKTFDSAETTASVYRLKRYSQKEVIAFANRILSHKNTSVDEESLDAYDNTLVCRAADGSCHIWINYAGLGFDYNDFDELETEPQAKSGCSREEIEQALQKFGISVPAQAAFTELSGEQQGTYQFSISNHETPNGKLLDGTLTCEYVENKSLKSVQQHILTYEKYKDCKILSQEEALEQLREGKYLENNFDSSNGKGKEALSVAVKKVHFGYISDSKGFYQPAWVFQGTVNGEKKEFFVPARK